MRNRKTIEYKYLMTEKKKEYMTFLKDFLNQELNGYNFDNERWGIKGYFKNTPPNKDFFSCEEQKFEIIDLINGLDSKYHTLFPHLGNKILIYPDIRINMRFELSKKEQRVWNKYKRTFNNILKEVLHDKKEFYNEKEKLVMNLFSELHMLFTEKDCFDFWILNLVERWGNTCYLKRNPKRVNNSISGLLKVS